MKKVMVVGLLALMALSVASNPAFAGMGCYHHDNGLTSRTYMLGNMLLTDWDNGLSAVTYGIGRNMYTDYSNGLSTNVYRIGNRYYIDHGLERYEIYKLGNFWYVNKLW